jgi:methyl-accepting chemotaxis protein
MIRAAWSQVDMLFTRIRLKKRIFLLILCSILALLAKLGLDAHLVKQQLQLAHNAQMLRSAESLAVAIPRLSQQGSLSSEQLAAFIPGYSGFVVPSTTRQLSQVDVSLPEQQKQVVDLGDKRVLVWPLSAQQLLVLVQSNQAIDEAQSAYLGQSFGLTVIIGALLTALLLLFSTPLFQQLRQLQIRLARMAKQDFSAVADINGNDEFSELEKVAESTRLHLITLFEQQKQVTEQLLDMAEQLTVCMDETKDAASDEFTQVELLATAMNEMVATAQEIANNADSASHATSEANELAKQGHQSVSQTIETINGLAHNIDSSSKAVVEVEERVANIGSVVATINSISEQTNLLALNAAIEAARAGEYGRGFAVVADEVRSLAQRTQQATVEIQQMIEQLQTSASSAGKLMHSSVEEAHESVTKVSFAGAGLDKIVSMVQQIAQMNYQIATAAEEQTSVSGEMNENLEQIKELIEGSVGVLEELSETAGIIRSHGDNLIEINQTLKR